MHKQIDDDSISNYDFQSFLLRQKTKQRAHFNMFSLQARLVKY